MNKIINLTQHNATPAQTAAGVVEPSPSAKTRLRNMLTFESLPSTSTLETTAALLAAWVYEEGHTHALIGGAPFFMSTLEFHLKEFGITPLHAFSVRESVEETRPDGSLHKTSIFKHVGFVET